MRGLAMYYAELTGPSGTPSLLSTTTSGTGAAKKTTESKGDAKAADAKSGGASGSPAYTISESMESLLDSISGQGAKDAAKSAGADTSSKNLDRAKQAQGLMQSALDHGKGLAGTFDKAIDTMKQGLGDILGALGMSSDGVADATAGFGDAMKSKLADLDFSKMAVDMQAARSQWSIESHGMELSIQDGDRKVQISFAKSTLDFRKDEARLQAGGGGMAAGFSTTTATGKSTGIIVRGEGFSEDEIKNILGKLNDMASKAGGDGMKGLAVLKPTTGKDGITHLKLDLSVPVEGLSSGTPATTTAGAADAKPQSVNITA
ncbi:hypothetical protein [Azospirillum agricola]|uniref:hypothetical protein n=1 Tax=Azospirillum agricola TaxID=1720247 RepID=UPI000A0F377E|nr:hypothetical protein [Azospirillum agricola]SMH57167.1 hypothetical protein SAMN02982994_4255 [Azospirillum lipoferum]